MELICAGRLSVKTFCFSSRSSNIVSQFESETEDCGEMISLMLENVCYQLFVCICEVTADEYEA